MPRGLTKFNKAWLDQIDHNGHRISEWCRQDEKSQYSGFRFLYNKVIGCENMGCLQLKQHSKGAKHKAMAKV